MAVNETIHLAGSSFSAVSDEIAARFMELVTAPYNYPGLLWITFPLVISMVFMNIYFGRYRQEELGWNTAVGNSMALIFVAMDLFRVLYQRLAEPSLRHLLLNDPKGVAVVFFLSLGSIWLLAADFFHVLPKKLAFLVSSSIPVSLSAYMAIILIYTDIPLDYITLLAALMLAAVLFIVMRIVKFLIPVYIKEEK